ncbi:Spermine synthase [Caldicellulosiruptor saccharolyticus DSM 8903]|uniref:Spermine synthase n=1 Tax=Caldicellulosiruptor saccharolyticus (strain ATCC 43494 / DSM 8903 / Tp8T 6331) TaxID=351627 RepID=A4XGL4_CALS8|nr:spermine synthase [Caldicellulosiruptor saccharolyticus]ABP66049.1 Spermine synthase [Caldicellulosiruptor saccharolyticus DSM 8903]
MILVVISLASISLFIYQVILNRIYSALFWYHYTFLITSFAIFGLGIGGIIAYNQRQKSENLKTDSLVKALFLLSISYIFSLGIIYVLPFQNNVLIYLILATLPFVAGGYFFSIAFEQFGKISNKLYFADLIGSGFGSIIVLLSLNNLGIYRSVILICIISVIAWLLFTLQLKKKTLLGGIGVLILFMLALFIPNKYVNSIEQNFIGFITNKTKTLGTITKSNQKAKIVYTKWNAFSRTDVIKVEGDNDEMIVTIDGTANAPMYRFDGKKSSLSKYKDDIEYLPFSFGNNHKTLIIGPGGGRDILYALAGNSKQITGVEINTSSIDAVRHFKEFNGDIYNRPEVKIYGEDGRNFVRKSKEKYDVIFLSLVMTNASQNIGYALSENYLFTVEALEDYMNHLTDNGKLAFLAHDKEDMSKLIATILRVLNKRGISIKEAPKYMAIFTKEIQLMNGNEHIHYPMIIVKNKPFSQLESKKLKETADKGKIAPLYIPYVNDKGPLYHIKQGHLTLVEFENGFSFSATPATDDKPYFYDFSKGVSPVLVFIFFFILIGSIILFTPIISQEKAFKPSLYFSSLGIGYMLIEIPLIQKFILYLGHPVIAFNYVLAGLLIGSGIGAYFSNAKVFNNLSNRIYLPALLVMVINIGLILSLNSIFKVTSNFSLVSKILIAVILVMIQGFFMGMPFPRGIKILSENKKKSKTIPVMWGLNGVMSVIGSVLSIMLSMEFGFTIAMLAGAILYGLISLQNRNLVIAK